MNVFNWYFIFNHVFLHLCMSTHPIVHDICVLYMCICVCRLVFNMNDIIERTGWKDGNHISIRARVIPNSKAMKPRRGHWSLRLHSREKRARIRAWRHSFDYGTFGGNVTLSMEKKCTHGSDKPIPSMVRWAKTLYFRNAVASYF